MTLNNVETHRAVSTDGENSKTINLFIYVLYMCFFRVKPKNSVWKVYTLNHYRVKHRVHLNSFGSVARFSTCFLNNGICINRREKSSVFGIFLTQLTKTKTQNITDGRRNIRIESWSMTDIFCSVFFVCICGSSMDGWILQCMMMMCYLKNCTLSYILMIIYRTAKNIKRGSSAGKRKEWNERQRKETKQIQTLRNCYSTSIKWSPHIEVCREWSICFRRFI